MKKIFIILLVIVVTACNSQQDNVQKKKKYTNNEYGFSVEYPIKWNGKGGNSSFYCGEKEGYKNIEWEIDFTRVDNYEFMATFFGDDGFYDDIKYVKVIDTISINGLTGIRHVITNNKMKDFYYEYIEVKTASVWYKINNYSDKSLEFKDFYNSFTLLNQQEISKNKPNLINFLNNPIDVDLYLTRHTNYKKSVIDKATFYLDPQFEDTLYYFYSFSDNDIGIVVAENKKSKELIEFVVFSEEKDLGKANFIGLTLKDIISKFGTHFRIVNNYFIYTVDNKLLIFEFDKGDIFGNKGIVTGFIFEKLNKYKVDSELIRIILNI